MSIVSPPAVGAAAFHFPELDAEDPSEVIAAVRRGLPVARFDALREMLGVSTSELTDVVGLSPSTLTRRRRRGDFDPDESERLLRLARIAARAVEVMDGIDAARAWLKQPLRALGGAVPLRYADTEPGAREVERVLLRLEHGVYS